MSRNDSETAAGASSPIPNPSTAPTTVEQALGPLTPEAVAEAKDAASKQYLEDTLKICVGLATLLLLATDPQDKAVVEVLAKVNVGMGDVQTLVGLAAALIQAAEERAAAEAASKAATARLDAARAKLHDANISFSNLARSRLGVQSPALEKFGIKPLGGRKGIKRAPKKAADKKDAKDDSKK